MINKTLFPDIVEFVKDKKQPREKPENQFARADRGEYKPPVFIGQNLYVKPSYVVSIPEFYSENKGMSIKNLENQKNLEDNSRKGRLSRKAVQGLRNSVNWLCLAAKKKYVFDRKTGKTFNFKVNFVTLTLPDTKNPISSADLQKRLLNPFLTYMRKYHNLNQYVWRLEFQANGKLHVHLSTDSFLNLQIIRNVWNGLLDKHGYLAEFHAKNGHKNPNSTDIHSTRKIKNMAAYLSKYMSKKNSVYEWDYKKKIDRLQAASLVLSEKKMFDLVKKVNREFEKKTPANKILSPLADTRKWYRQRLNFWNSNFNPRPITGRIWSCSYELSRASKLRVHIPANECAAELKCLFNPEIQYKEIFTPEPKQKNPMFGDNDPINRPRKIGEVYFLTAQDWISNIRGAIRRAFDQARSNIRNLCTVINFELDYY